MSRSTLLVIDDEPNILTSIKRALELEDFSVIVAGSGSVGLAKLGDCAVDMVLLDVVMPEMGGLDVLAKIRTAHPSMPVVMMSGNATIDTAVQATKLGAQDFVEKPLSTDKLMLTVQNALEVAKLRRENAQLRKRTERYEMIGSGTAMASVFDKIQKTAPTNGRVLITGENGTGKELVARAIHENSARKDAAFIRLNCAAIPSELIESELFGHEKGAFTGATQQRRGKFELADGGTLFLDEIGDMNQNAQAKVLRALQEGEIERVGGHETIRADVRVLAATNKDLNAEIADGRFRQDLFYRLNVVPIELPPLRTRRSDIGELTGHFLAVVCEDNGHPLKTITDAAITLLMQYEWPGNVRELKNVVERLVILTGTKTEITVDDVQDALPSVKQSKGSYQGGVPLKEQVAAAERDIILEALAQNNHHISNTAKDLHLERSHLYKKMKALGINPRSDS